MLAFAFPCIVLKKLDRSMVSMVKITDSTMDMIIAYFKILVSFFLLNFPRSSATSLDTATLMPPLDMMSAKEYMGNTR